ncbi:MAG: hypothetical protein GX495_18220 [Chloroflexi bacterium]|nr:hypothetical protein [Chloroflexota bacterium]
MNTQRNDRFDEVRLRARRRLRVVGEVISQALNAPILSGAMITFLFFQLPTDIPKRLEGFGWALLFLSLIPLLSLLFYIPGKVKDWKRIIKRQRTASFVFMLISYPVGFLILELVDAPKIFRAIAITYTLVTLGLIVFNLLLRYKASGHAAGVAGPVGAMIYFYGLIAAPLLALLPLVTWARVAAKGHDIGQTIVGALLSLAITFGVLYAYGFSPLSGPLY